MCQSGKNLTDERVNTLPVWLHSSLKSPEVKEMLSDKCTTGKLLPYVMLGK